MQADPTSGDWEHLTVTLCEHSFCVDAVLSGREPAHLYGSSILNFKKLETVSAEPTPTVAQGSSLFHSLTAICFLF